RGSGCITVRRHRRGSSCRRSRDDDAPDAKVERAIALVSLAAARAPRAAPPHFPATRSLHGAGHGSSTVTVAESAFRYRNCGAQNRPRGSIEDFPTRAWRLARRLVLEQSRVDLARTRTHRVDADANRARRALAFAIKVD